MEDFNHFLIRNLSKIVIVETNRSEHRVVSRHTMSSASRRNSERLSLGATGAAQAQAASDCACEWRAEPHGSSRPSQRRRQLQSPCGQRPPRVRDCPSNARAVARFRRIRRSQTALNPSSSIPTCSMTSSLRTMIEAPPSTTAPMANSGWKGTPTLRTRIKSSGASSAAATSAATATPPRGGARIAGSSSLYRASATASLRPASERFLNGMAFSSAGSNRSNLVRPFQVLAGPR